MTVPRLPGNGVEAIGLLLVGLGIALAITGALLLVGARFGIGSLPGDVRISGQNWSCFFPITTSIIISVVLSLLLYLWSRWTR